MVDTAGGRCIYEDSPPNSAGAAAEWRDPLQPENRPAAVSVLARVSDDCRAVAGGGA